MPAAEGMVPALSIVFMLITLALSVGVPIVLLVVLASRKKGLAGPFFAGMLGFVVPQLFIRIPILQALALIPGYAGFMKENAALGSFLLALTAGLFETSGRLLVFALILRKRRSYALGFAAGAGHGAIESIVLIGATYINNLVFSLMINMGALDALSSQLPAGTLDSAVDALTGYAPHVFLLAGVERVFTMTLHIALSVLLLYFMMKRRTLLGFVAVAAVHTAVDFAAAYLSSLGVDMLLIEGVMLIVAVLSALYLAQAKKNYPIRDAATPVPPEEAPGT